MRTRTDHQNSSPDRPLTNCAAPSRAMVLMVLAAMLCTGCAVGNRHDYGTAQVSLQLEGGGRVAVATHDLRGYVVSGDKSEDFVGLQRGGYGNPFDVGTASGRSLATEMTAAICASLSSHGFQAQPVPTSPGEEPGAVLARLRQTGADRLLLLSLLNWKSDTYKSTALAYEVTLSVHDPQGAKLGDCRLEGSDDLGGSFWNPMGHARQAVPKAYAAKLAELLSNSEIQAALRSAPRESG